jgi:hypothetical protein
MVKVDLQVLAFEDRILGDFHFLYSPCTHKIRSLRKGDEMRQTGLKIFRD